VAADTIEYGGKVYDVPEGVSPEDALESLKAAIPELADAALEPKGSNASGSGKVYVAKPRTGTKG
jgi:hypothetical protein